MTGLVEAICARLTSLAEEERMTDHVRVSGAEAGAEPHTHGEWLKIEAPGSAPLFVWGCGCCSLEVWTEETLREAMPHRSVQPVVEPEIVRAWERVHG